jgi:hypothetical protein
MDERARHDEHERTVEAAEEHDPGCRTAVEVAGSVKVEQIQEMGELHRREQVRTELCLG